MKKIFSILFALALVLSFSLVATTPVAAATITVGPSGDHATIQAAVDAADPGDTIEVAAGTYNENVVVWKDVTLKSAVKHGAVVVGQGVGDYADWAYDVFRVIADGATVEGFDIRMWTPDNYDGDWAPADWEAVSGLTWDGHDGVAVKASGVTVKDNRITQPGAPDPFTEWVHATGAAISAIGGALTGVTIEGNEIYGTTGAGVWNWAMSSSVIQKNEIEGTQYTGILLVWSSGNTIADNQILNCGTQWNLDDGIRFGGNSDSNTATGNTITGSSRDGIQNHFTNTPGNVANYNSISGNAGYGVNNRNTGVTFDAKDNWWGSVDGPQDTVSGTNEVTLATCGTYTVTQMLNAVAEISSSLGDKVSDNVDYCPWIIPSSVGTATGTGTASFVATGGPISLLTSVPEGSLPAAAQATKPINFPDGLFSFTIAGLTNGQTVIVTITLPSGAAPTQYWKYHPLNEGGWVQIPMTIVGPPNVIRITLVDGGLGDDDGLANGVIVDQGGNGNPTVGWETYPISKVRVLLPWIALFAAIMAGASLLMLRRRRAQS